MKVLVLQGGRNALSIQRISEMVAEHLSSHGTSFPVLKGTEYRRIVLSSHEFRRGVWTWNDGVQPARSAVIFPTSGNLHLSTFTDYGRQVLRHRGCKAVILPSGSRAQLEFKGSEPACDIIWIPESMISGFAAAKERLVLVQENVMVAGARAFLASTLESQGFEPCDLNLSAAMENTLLAIYVGIIVQSSLQNRPVSFAYSQFEAARNLVLTQAEDPNFSPERLANQLNISTRQLQRIFARFGMTPSSMIRSYRIEQAQNYLNDQSLSGMNMSEIAKRVGFSSSSAMRRAIRQEKLRSSPGRINQCS